MAFLQTENLPSSCWLFHYVYACSRRDFSQLYGEEENFLLDSVPCVPSFPKIGNAFGNYWNGLERFNQVEEGHHIIVRGDKQPFLHIF